MIEPITLGGGKTLFPTDGRGTGRSSSSLTQTAKTGVQVCRYHPVSADLRERGSGLAPRRNSRLAPQEHVKQLASPAP